MSLSHFISKEEDKELVAPALFLLIHSEFGIILSCPHGTLTDVNLVLCNFMYLSQEIRYNRDVPQALWKKWEENMKRFKMETEIS